MGLGEASDSFSFILNWDVRVWFSNHQPQNEELHLSHPPSHYNLSKFLRGHGRHKKYSADSFKSIEILKLTFQLETLIWLQISPILYVTRELNCRRCTFYINTLLTSIAYIQNLLQCNHPTSRGHFISCMHDFSLFCYNFGGFLHTTHFFNVDEAQEGIAKDGTRCIVNLGRRWHCGLRKLHPSEAVGIDQWIILTMFALSVFKSWI